jgi:hypothetical protein
MSRDLEKLAQVFLPAWMEAVERGDIAGSIPAGLAAVFEVEDAELADARPEYEKRIDAMSLDEMIHKWRFAPLGTFQVGDPETEYFQARLFQLRDVDPARWVASSKAASY